MKRIIAVMICLVILLVPAFVVEAESNDILIAPIQEQIIRVQLNGEIIDFTDENGQVVNPCIINDRTMVPMRKIFEVFGAEVTWNGEERIITATTDTSEIVLQIENEKATVKNSSGEEKEIILDSVPVIYEDRTLVPVRFIAESLNKKVDWDAENRTVIIVDTDWITAYIKENAPTLYQYLNEDREKIITYSSNGEISGKLKYTDKDSRTNTSTLNLKGTFSTAISGELIRLQLNANITGKGSLKDAISKANLEKVTANIIVDLENQIIFIKGTLVDELNKDGWVKLSMQEEPLVEYQNIIPSEEETTTILDGIQNAINQSSLNVASYENAKMILDFVCYMFREDTFKVATKGTTNTYTWSVGVTDLLKIAQLEEEELQKIETVLSGSVDVKTSLTEGIEKETESNISFEYLQEREQLAAEISIKNTTKSVNDTVSITIPDEKEVVEY